MINWNHRSTINLIVLPLCLLSVSALYTNCGSAEHVSKDSGDRKVASIDTINATTGDPCQDILFKEFLKPAGYYQKIQSMECRGCHHERQDVAPKFASNDFLEAWSAFQQKELTEGGKISKNMTGDHKTTKPRTHNQSLVAALQIDMGIKRDEFNQCVGQTTPTENLKYSSENLSLSSIYVAVQPTADDLLLKSSVIGTSTGLATDNTSYSLHKFQRLVYDEATSTNKIITIKKYSAKVLTYDLVRGRYTDLSITEKIPVLVSFEVQPNIQLQPIRKTINSVSYVTGFKENILTQLSIKNVKLKWNSSTISKTSSIYLNNLKFSVNNKTVSDATIYSILAENLCTMEAINAMPGVSSQLIVLPVATKMSTIQFAVNFEHVSFIERASMPCSKNGSTATPVLPTTVTFAQLSNISSPYGIFAKNCASCHRVGGTGTFDISNYTVTKSKINAIISRTNNASNPMPQNGLMSDNERDLLQLWFSKGMPEK